MDTSLPKPVKAVRRRSDQSGLGERLLDRACSSVALALDVPPSDTPFGTCDHLMRLLDIRYESDRIDIPDSGPLLVLANHPTGIPDGIALGHLIGQARPDLKVVTHPWLHGKRSLRPFTIPCDIDNQACRLSQAARHLFSGGALILFPSGKIDRICQKSSEEKARTAERLATRALELGGSVIRIRISSKGGRLTSALFQALSCVHEDLGTLFAVCNARGARLYVRKA